MDREKVIKGLKIQLDDLQKYADADEMLTLTQEQAKEIVALLKEQEAVKPKNDAFGHPYCPKCKVLVYQTWGFCPHCGQKVKWE